MTKKSPDRMRARALCNDHAAHGDHVGWFEALYREGVDERATIPWADLIANPHLVVWHRRTGFDLVGKRCLKIGCGLGDDAEYLAGAGGEVTAFDVSTTAVDWARRRFPASRVRYVVSDLLTAPTEWRGAFDLVLEAYTLQVLPPALRADAIPRVAEFVSPSGTLLVICRGRERYDPCGAMPWPLTADELLAFERAGLSRVSFEDYLDDEDPPVRRFRAEYRR